jgi:hypothetical protein
VSSLEEFCSRNEHDLTSGDFQANSIDELIERSEDRAIKFVEWGGFGVHESSIVLEGLENRAGEWRVAISRNTSRLTG